MARTFDSMESAVAHAFSHPRMPAARRDATRLRGSAFVDACWTVSEWVLRFDCNLSLHVWIDSAEVRWSLRPSPEVLPGLEFQRIGATPIIFKWAGAVGLWPMDCSSLVARRRGARFKDLFVSECGFFLYLHGHLILQLGPAERTCDGRGMIFALEDD